MNVPKAESESAYFKQYQRLTLLLGAVDDVDVTYFNGVEVGRTGSVMDDTKGHYKTNRCYDVPAKHIRWDAENVIAVRVFDSDGDGGMHKGIPTLLPPVWNDFVTVDIDHGHANGIYPSGAPMELSVTIQNTAFETIKGTVRFQVGSDTWLADQRETFSDISKPVQLSAGKSHIETLTFEPPAAGFYQVTCTFTRDGDKTPISQSRMRGYAPEKMDRPTDAPKDLRAFWDKTIAELATVTHRNTTSRRARSGAPHTPIATSWKCAASAMSGFARGSRCRSLPGHIQCC